MSKGSHIMLHNSDHVLGRTVAEVSCQFESPAVSGRHCTITRKLTTLDGSVKPSGSEAVPGDHYVVFVKDSRCEDSLFPPGKLKSIYGLLGGQSDQCNLG